MSFYTDKWIKIRGLNKRTLAVDRTQISFLEEMENDDKLCTNIHLMNGKWMTSALSLDQVHALLTEDAQQESEERVERWREQAKDRRKFDAEIEEAVKNMGLNGKPKASSKTVNPDGSFRLTLDFDAPAVSNADV